MCVFIHEHIQTHAHTHTHINMTNYRYIYIFIYIYIYIYIYKDQRVFLISLRIHLSMFDSFFVSFSLYLFIYSFINFFISMYGFYLLSRVFASGLGDRGSIPGRVIPKTQKSYLMQPCLALSSIRWRLRVKWSIPGERSSAFPYTPV